jgi:Mismatch repair ATPase (MutS family)
MGISNYILVFICLVAFILIYLLSRKKRNEKLKVIINNMWAKLPGKTANEEELKSISTYFENLKNIASRKMYIDNITWNDLDLDKVFNKINNTFSTVGEEYLYNLLRWPVFEDDQINESRRLISLFQKDRLNRQKIQYLFAKLGKIRHIDISDFFFCMNDIRYRNKKYYILLAFMLYISTIVMVFFNIQIGGIAFVLTFITNATVYYKVKNTIDCKLASISYIIQMIYTANAILKLDLPAISFYQRKLKESVAKVKKVNSKGFYALYKAQDPITEYVESLFLVELIAFESCHNFIIKNRDEIKNIYEILGYIESMISIASYREYLDFYCEPHLYGNSNGMMFSLKAIDLFHPLINNPRVYSFNFSKPILITGSNASGKSTFLKSVAINAILAQTIHTCLAREFCLPHSLVFSSMALRDNILSNESYFIVELKSLKRIIDVVNLGIPCLCIVDEVLRGTNTIERIAASSEVLTSLNSNNCICIAATHDIELTTILDDKYENYHFREEFTEDNNIVFIYTLYPGKSSTKNALKLLKIIGYDSSIVKRAQERSDKFISKGLWKK